MTRRTIHSTIDPWLNRIAEMEARRAHFRRVAATQPQIDICIPEPIYFDARHIPLRQRPRRETPVTVRVPVMTMAEAEELSGERLLALTGLR